MSEELIAGLRETERAGGGGKSRGRGPRKALASWAAPEWHIIPLVGVQPAWQVWGCKQGMDEWLGWISIPESACEQFQMPC